MFPWDQEWAHVDGCLDLGDLCLPWPWKSLLGPTRYFSPVENHLVASVLSLATFIGPTCPPPCCHYLAFLTSKMYLHFLPDQGHIIPFLGSNDLILLEGGV